MTFHWREPSPVSHLRCDTTSPASGRGAPGAAISLANTGKRGSNLGPISEKLAHDRRTIRSRRPPPGICRVAADVAAARPGSGDAAFPPDAAVPRHDRAAMARDARAVLEADGGIRRAGRHDLPACAQHVAHPERARTPQAGLARGHGRRRAQGQCVDHRCGPQADRESRAAFGIHLCADLLPLRAEEAGVAAGDAEGAGRGAVGRTDRAVAARRNAGRRPACARVRGEFSIAARSRHCEARSDEQSSFYCNKKAGLLRLRSQWRERQSPRRCPTPARGGGCRQDSRRGSAAVCDRGYGWPPPCAGSARCRRRW